MGSYPGVTVAYTPSVQASSLFADRYCGPDTRLVYYMAAGSVLSRTFTKKDTHSPRGELLVVYSDSRGSMYDFDMIGQTTAVLGFQPPSFTYGTDLILPVSVNDDLRHLLVPEVDGMISTIDEDDAAYAAIDPYNNIYVPQV